MHATVTWQHDQQYDAVSQSGHLVTMDGEAAHKAGASPMELVLMALCGCASVDVVSILRKKREPLRSLIVPAVAEQAPEAPRVFTHTQLACEIGGAGSAKAVEDAVALSKNKYCSVSKMLEKAATIDSVITYGEKA